MELNELKTCLETCGVVGAGGAGFPTHLKLDTRVRTIVLNCSECEPLLTVHRQLLAVYTKEILSALNMLAETLSADVIIAVKKSYAKTLSAVSEEIKRYPHMRLIPVTDVYPAGDEIILIREVTGITPPPGTLPAESGMLALNVETVYNIYHAVNHNAHVTHKWVTVTGEVNRPVTLKLPVGSTISKAVEAAGGAKTDEPAYIIGGPMMGYLAADGGEKIKKTTNAVIVLPADHFLVQSFNHNPAVDLNRAASACCQCRVCTDMCPRKMIGYPIEPHRIMRALTMRDTSDTDAFKGAMYCSLCGVCERAACPQGLAPRSLLRILKTALGKAGVRPERIPLGAPDPDRDLRLVDEARLTSRLGLSKYGHEAPIQIPVNGGEAQ